MSEPDAKPPWLFEVVKSLAVLGVVGVLCVKTYQTPLDLKVDFSTLLSLLLALFSVGLAALFYFKATETSNTFYDNTHKFTRDIAQLLAKMESGFGERLRHLDEGYSSVRDHLRQLPARATTADVEETKKQIEEERQELQRSLAERNDIIKNLLERSQLQEDERKAIAEALEKKEAEAASAQRALERMNRRLARERASRRQSTEGGFHFDPYTSDRVIRVLGPETVPAMSLGAVKSAFDDLAEDLIPPYLRDLREQGFYSDEGLTLAGARYIRELASGR